MAALAEKGERHFVYGVAVTCHLFLLDIPVNSKCVRNSSFLTYTWVGLGWSFINASNGVDFAHDAEHI